MKILLATTLFAFGMAMLFAFSGLRSKHPDVQVPVSLAFLAAAQLGVAVTMVIRTQDKRIQELERLLQEQGK